MAFIKTLNNTQKVRATIKLTHLDGTDEPILGLLPSVIDGDGTFSQLENDGTPMPANQIFLISGTAASDIGIDTNYQVDAQRSGGTVRMIMSIRVTTAPLPEVTADVIFSDPEPK